MRWVVSSWSSRNFQPRTSWSLGRSINTAMRSPGLGRNMVLINRTRSNSGMFILARQDRLGQQEFQTLFGKGRSADIPVRSNVLPANVQQIGAVLSERG